MGSVQRTSSARAAGALNPDLTPGQSHPGGHTRTSSIGIAGRRALAWLRLRLPGGYKCASGGGGGGKWALLSNGDEASVMQDDEVLEIRYAP